MPGGFGERGFEGKVNAISYARENGVPYLGICYGMQAAAVEFARNVCGLEGANTTEVDPDTPHAVIGLITEWLDASGKVESAMKSPIWAAPCVWAGRNANSGRDRSRITCMGSEIITERHRHRYEFNNHYREVFQKNGMCIRGISMDEIAGGNY